MNEFQQLSTYLTEHILSTYNSSGLVQTNKLENILNESVYSTVSDTIKQLLHYIYKWYQWMRGRVEEEHADSPDEIKIRAHNDVIRTTVQKLNSLKSQAQSQADIDAIDKAIAKVNSRLILIEGNVVKKNFKPVGQMMTKSGNVMSGENPALREVPPLPDIKKATAFKKDNIV